MESDVPPLTLHVHVTAIIKTELDEIDPLICHRFVEWGVAILVTVVELVFLELESPVHESAIVIPSNGLKQVLLPLEEALVLELG